MHACIGSIIPIWLLWSPPPPPSPHSNFTSFFFFFKKYILLNSVSTGCVNKGVGSSTGTWASYTGHTHIPQKWLSLPKPPSTGLPGTILRFWRAWSCVRNQKPVWMHGCHGRAKSKRKHFKALIPSSSTCIHSTCFLNDPYFLDRREVPTQVSRLGRALAGTRSQHFDKIWVFSLITDLWTTEGSLSKSERSTGL